MRHHQPARQLEPNAELITRARLLVCARANGGGLAEIGTRAGSVARHDRAASRLCRSAGSAQHRHELACETVRRRCSRVEQNAHKRITLIPAAAAAAAAALEDAWISLGPPSCCQLSQGQPGQFVCAIAGTRR